jgi:hypothetical protein
MLSHVGNTTQYDLFKEYPLLGCDAVLLARNTSTLPETSGGMFLRNVGKFISDCTALYSHTGSTQTFFWAADPEAMYNLCLILKIML